MRGKQAFLKNFWLCVLVGILLFIAVDSGNSNRNNNNQNYQEDNVSITKDSAQNSLNLSMQLSAGNQRAMNTLKSTAGRVSIGIGPVKWMIGIVSSGLGMLIAGGLFVAMLIISILIFHPLEVGCRRFYFVNLYRKAELREVLFAFQNGWANASVILFIRNIKLFLWTLLLVVPGIIKAYEYRMIPYLLAENPGMDSQTAFAESKRMMDGVKMDTFILDFSFIGWQILSAFTGGIVGVFWTNPYVNSTNAALYEALKER